MAVAEPAEVRERGGSAVGVVVDVVAFEVAAVVAAFDVAFAAADDECGQHFGGNVAAEVRDGGDVLALLDDEGEERGAEQFGDPGDVDGSDAGDLAHLPVDRRRRA